MPWTDHFLDRLGLNPDRDYRFLGDAAFDTRYASNAISNQTGSRYRRQRFALFAEIEIRAAH
ncbi:hypothetical protein, partial [Enterobacter cloacae]|uniref:hypothetical protein n=1 Tax=Enterobacter cloacae TaxID=550 RepID=UPI0021D1C25E